MRDSALALLVIIIGGALLAGGLYLLSDEISGDLTPLVYFAMIGFGLAGLVRGIGVLRGSRPPS